MKRVLAVSLTTLSLVVGCGGGGGGSSSPQPQPPSVQPTSKSVNVIGTAPSSVSGNVAAIDPQGLSLTYSIAQNASVGNATIDSSTGAFTYTVPGNTTSTSDSFTVTVSDGKLSANGTVTVQLNIDPLLANQWHIQNTGASAFSTTLPTAGNDLNVAGAWAAGYTGKGIKVGIVDSGVEIAHEDLAANIDTTHSYNFLTGSSDPTASSGVVGPDHGTMVAGIIGAVAFNGKGGRGVAYNASIRGYNLLAAGVTPFLTDYALALGGASYSSDNDVFNASFSVSSFGGTFLPPLDSSLIAVSANLANLRGGKGAVLVNAAGNDFQAWEGDQPDSPVVCQLAKQYGVSCGDPAHDTRLGGVTPIIVGALNANGVKSSYGSTGASIWVSAPGGEFGLSSNYFSSASGVSLQPAIVTTARDGCANGMGMPPQKYNALDSQGSSAFAPNCQYTAMMNGTSSATPSVAATVALMLEANPNLTSRDVKEILAKTAKKVDPNRGVVSYNSSGSTIVLDQGWFTNAAGYPFSNWYGFGGVDASAAAAMAKTFTNYLPPQQSGSITWSFATNTVVPPLSTTGTFATFTAAPAFGTVEQIVLITNLSSSPGLYCNQIEVVSPSGTKSILMHAANGFSVSGVAQPVIVNGRLLTNAFYGESAAGTWKLSFFDFCSPGAVSTIIATTDVETLIITGH